MKLQQASNRSVFVNNFASKRLARQSLNDGSLSKVTLIVNQNVGKRWACGQPQEIWIPNKEVDIQENKRFLSTNTHGFTKISVLDALQILHAHRAGNPYKALQVVCDDKTLGWFVPAQLVCPDIEDQMVAFNKQNLINKISL